MHRIDHVVFGVGDLDVAARRLWDECGLEAQPRSDHAGAGTANRIVPVGNDQMIELLAISDSGSPHPIVPWLARLLANGDRLLQVMIDPGEIDATAARLGEPVRELERVADDGRRIAFRLTGIAGSFGPGMLPGFVSCSEGREWRCGFEPPKHKVRTGGIRWVELGSDEAKVWAQIPDRSLPFRFVPGRPGVSAVALELDGREVVLRA